MPQDLSAPLFSYRHKITGSGHWCEWSASKYRRRSGFCLVRLPCDHICDSTSSFKWHGKKAAYQVLQSKPTLCGALQHLGSQWHIPGDLLALCEEFVHALYRPARSSVNNINELRYQLFTAKAAQSDHLPPTQDALHLHLQQANYQAVIWSRDLEAKPAVPTPSNHGWQLVDSVLTIEWLRQRPAPDELLLLVRCSCQSGCASNRCSCRRSGMQCTDACRCDDCENQSVIHAALDDVTSSEHSEVEADDSSSISDMEIEET